MLKFIREYQLLIVVTIIVVIAGLASSLIAYVLIPLAFVLFMVRGYHKEVLLFFYMILVFSDNNNLEFASKIKPLLIILFAAFSLKHGSLRAGNKVFKPFAIFFVYTLVLLWFSPDLMRSFQKNLSYILLFLTIPGYTVYLIDKYGSKVIMDMVNLSVVIMVIGLVFTLLFPEIAYSHGGRLRGILGNPKGLAMFCFFNLLLFQLFKDHLDDSWLSKVDRIIIIGIILVTLVLTGSRTSWLAVLIFLFFRQFSRIPPMISFLLLATIVWAYDYIFIVGVAFVTELGLTKQFRLNESEAVGFASGRTVAWKYAWQEIQKNYFFGRGWAYDEIWIFGPVQETLKLLNHQGGVHNTFLIIWLNTGIIGLIIYGISLFYVFLKAARNSMLALPILFAGLFVANFEPWLGSSLNPYTIQFLICLAVILHLPKIRENEKNGFVKA
ncbi:MAG: O-antigen ligase family protein [Flavobacteriales bacterium]|nr:O-antigen ligase family protein [Flavobacteriales bacterium]